MHFNIFIQYNCKYESVCLFLVVASHIFSENGVFLSLKIVFDLANSADPDTKPLYTAFHLGLHCLPKYMYLFIGKQNKKGSI